MKKISIEAGEQINISQYPNFSSTGNVKGMKEKYYGKDALFIQCGNYIYNVPQNIYNSVDKLNKKTKIHKITKNLYLLKILYSNNQYIEAINDEEVIKYIYNSLYGYSVTLYHMNYDGSKTRIPLYTNRLWNNLKKNEGKKCRTLKTLLESSNGIMEITDAVYNLEEEKYIIYHKSGKNIIVSKETYNKIKEKLRVIK